MDISHVIVARVWRKHGMKPHRIEHYMASNDPDFERKAADVIGSYLNPPAHAAVFYVDENTYSASDRKSARCPSTPPSIPRPVTSRERSPSGIRPLNSSRF